MDQVFLYSALFLAAVMVLALYRAIWGPTVLDRLVAEGAIQSWGLACQMVGPPGESCMFWVTAADWAGMSTVEKAYDDSRKAMTEDDVEWTYTRPTADRPALQRN